MAATWRGEFCFQREKCMPFEMQKRSWKSALWRGFRKSCPNCGDGRLLNSYLRVQDSCPVCGTALHHQKADDAPPYFTMVVVGHIIVPLMLIAEKRWHPDLAFHLTVWPILTTALTLWLLPRIKGSIVGLQWALRMHGFADEADVTRKA
jgi:uncharacterized protein (DUF983 family)